MGGAAVQVRGTSFDDRVALRFAECGGQHFHLVILLLEAAADWRVDVLEAVVRGPAKLTGGRTRGAAPPLFLDHTLVVPNKYLSNEFYESLLY